MQNSLFYLDTQLDSLVEVCKDPNILWPSVTRNAEAAIDEQMRK